MASLLGGGRETSLVKLQRRPSPAEELEIMGGCPRRNLGDYELPEVDLYWTLNDFWKPKRDPKPGKLQWIRGEGRHLNSLNAVWVDLDYHQTEWNSKSKEEVRKSILDALGKEMEPSVFAWSGRGAYIIYLLNPILHEDVGRIDFWKAVRRWRRIGQRLCKRLEGWGSDLAASCTPNGVLRAPGSINSKSMKPVEFEVINPTALELDGLEAGCNAWEFEKPFGSAIRPGREIRVPKPIPPGLKKGSLVGLIECRYRDLETLRIDRNSRKYNWEGLRNKFAFTWAQMRLQSYAKGVGVPTDDELLAINDSFASENCRSAASWEIRSVTRKKSYTLKNSRIIADLAITEEEMRRLRLSTLISKKVKLERRKAAQGGGEDGRAARSTRRDAAVLQAVEGGADSVAAVVLATGVSRAGVYRSLAALGGAVVSKSGRLTRGAAVPGGAPLVIQVGGEDLSPENHTPTEMIVPLGAGAKEPKGREALKDLPSTTSILSSMGFQKTIVVKGSSWREEFYLLDQGATSEYGQADLHRLTEALASPDWSIIGMDVRGWLRGVPVPLTCKARVVDLHLAASVVDARAAGWGIRRMARHFLADPMGVDAVDQVELGMFLVEKIKAMGLGSVYESELALGWDLYATEVRGLRLDKEALAASTTEVERRLATLQGWIDSEAGYHLDVGNASEVGRFLFGERGLPVLRRGKRGAPSTDSTVLEELAVVDQVAGFIAEARRLSSVRGECIAPLLSSVDRDGLIHPEFHQGLSVNGRFTTRNPNVQGIISSGKIGTDVRAAIVPRDGKVLLGFDLSQIEIRALAHLCGDTSLIALFWSESSDIYSQTAARILGIPVESVTSSQRTWAKEALIASIYGMGPAGLAAKLRCSVVQAKEFVRSFDNAFPGVNLWKDSLLQQARRDGFVTLPNGVRRFIDGLLCPD